LPKVVTIAPTGLSRHLNALGSYKNHWNISKIF